MNKVSITVPEKRFSMVSLSQYGLTSQTGNVYKPDRIISTEVLTLITLVLFHSRRIK